MSQIITPSNPINGQEIVVNGTVLVYVEAEQVWRVQVESEAGNVLLLAGKLDKPDGDPTVPSVVEVAANGAVSYAQLSGGVTPHNPRVSIREVNDLDGSNQELVIPNTASELIDVDVTVGPTGDFTFLDMHTFSASGTNTITFDDARPQRFIVNVPPNPTEAITVHYTLRYRDESTMAIHSVMRVYTIQVGFIWCFGVSSSLPNGLINTGQGILRLGEVVTRTTTADADKFWGAVNTDQFENFRLSSGSVFVDFYENDPETGLQYPDLTIGEVVFRQFQIERGSSLGSLTVTVTGV